MKTRNLVRSLILACLLGTAAAADGTAPNETTLTKSPLGIRVSVKMTGPYSQPADLQIICILKHVAGGDVYQGAAKELNEKLDGVIGSLRDRGEFLGELGETMLFTPLAGSIPAKQLLVIGLGDGKELSTGTLHLVGRIAAREAVRLKAKHVAWAPVIRDEGNFNVDVGAGDRAFVEQFLSAYDTERRLQEQGLAPKSSIEDLVVEAGPAYFDSAVKQIGEGIDSISADVGSRAGAPYSSVGK
jgi:hypothetical protein